MLSPISIILRIQRLEGIQCRSRWGGSLWATSSRSTLFANSAIFVSVVFKELMEKISKEKLVWFSLFVFRFSLFVFRFSFFAFRFSLFVFRFSFFVFHFCHFAMSEIRYNAISNRILLITNRENMLFWHLKYYFDIRTEWKYAIWTFKILFWHSHRVEVCYFDIQNLILTFALSRNRLFWHSKSYFDIRTESN